MTGLKRVLAFCTECPFVEATKASGEFVGTEEDPAYRHFRGTDHVVGSYVPEEGSELKEQWEVAYWGDWSRLEGNDRLMELAQGDTDA